jgi:hypothetical protein
MALKIRSLGYLKDEQLRRGRAEFQIRHFTEPHSLFLFTV